MIFYYISGSWNKIQYPNYGTIYSLLLPTQKSQTISTFAGNGMGGFDIVGISIL